MELETDDIEERLMELETDDLTARMAYAQARLDTRGQPHTIEEIAAISQAISLKRIADAMDKADKLAACITENNMVRVDSF